MPGNDQTGPKGEGPKTGKGLGICAENDQPDTDTPRFFQRIGARFRRGIGRRGAGQGQGRNQGRGQGQGRMGGPQAAGPSGFCVCPDCNHKVEHLAGKPCNQQKCPKCGANMLRE